jgi:tetratricopeptide (TPR) repeat protein
MKIPKLILAIALLATFGLFSCNNNEIKSSNSNPQSNQVSVPNNNSNIITDVGPLEKLVKDDSLNVINRLNLGTAYYSNMEFDKAIVQYMKVLDLEKKNIDAIINLGNIYYDINENQKAVDFYKKALAIDNKNLNVSCDMATCLDKLGKTDEAIKILKDNIKIDFNHAQSHHNLSKFYEKKGNKTEEEKEEKIFNDMTKK